MIKFCHSHLTHNIFNYCMRRFFFGLVYMKWQICRIIIYIRLLLVELRKPFVEALQITISKSSGQELLLRIIRHEREYAIK